MEPTIMPVVDWNALDQIWEEYRYGGLNLETRKIVSYRTSKSKTRIIMWDDWSASFTELLDRVIKRNGYPIAVGKNNETSSPPDEFLIITNDAEAIMAILTFQ